MNKRLYWLKLEEDFFSIREIKRLRRRKDGDTYVLLAQKMMLSALKGDGTIPFDGLDEDLAEAIALDIDEDVDQVRTVIEYLVTIGWAEISEDGSLYLTCVIDRTGSESPGASRMRKARSKKKASQCDTDVTQELCVESQCDKNVTPEKEKEREEDIEKETDKEEEGGAHKRTASSRSVDNQSILDDYHRTCTRLKAGKLTASTKRYLDESLQKFSAEQIHMVFVKAQGNRFLCGDCGKDWSASFGWLVQSENIEKVLSGKYDDRKEDAQNEENRYDQLFDRYVH